MFSSTRDAVLCPAAYQTFSNHFPTLMSLLRIPLVILVTRSQSQSQSELNLVILYEPMNGLNLSRDSRPFCRSAFAMENTGNISVGVMYENSF